MAREDQSARPRHNASGELGPADVNPKSADLLGHESFVVCRWLFVVCRSSLALCPLLLALCSVFLTYCPSSFVPCHLPLPRSGYCAWLGVYGLLRIISSIMRVLFPCY